MPLPTLPPFELALIRGGTATDLDLGEKSLLLFTIPDCAACAEGMMLLENALAVRSDITRAVVVPDASEATQAMISDSSIEWVALVDEVFLLASVFGIGRVPTVVLLEGGEMVGRLDRGFTEDGLAEALAEPFGNLEPEDPEQTAGEATVTFQQLNEPMLLMFAGADCGYCHHMLPSVFEIAETLDTTIVITDELFEPEPFESDAARLSVLLDPNWQLANAFAVPTVPTVFFIDTDGSIVWSHTGIVEGLPIIAEAFLQRLSD